MAVLPGYEQQYLPQGALTADSKAQQFSGGAEGMQDLAKGVGAVENFAMRTVIQSETTKAAATIQDVNAEYEQQVMNLKQSMTDEQKAKMIDDYQNKIRAAGDNIISGDARRFYEHNASVSGHQFTRNLFMKNADLQAKEQVDAALNFGNGLSQSISVGSATMAESMAKYNAFLDISEKTGALTADAKKDLQAKQFKEFVFADAKQLMRLDSDNAPDIIKSRDYGAFISGTERETLIREAENHKNSKKSDYLSKLKEEHAIRHLEAGIEADAILKAKLQGQPVADRIANSPKLDFEYRNSLSSSVRAFDNNASKLNAEQTANDLFERMMLPPGDPRRITEIQQIQAKFGDLKGKYNDVVKKFQDRNRYSNTPEAPMYKAVEETAKTIYLKKDQYGNPVDQFGPSTFGDTMSRVNSFLEEGQKKGIPLRTLLDPKNQEGVYSLLNPPSRQEMRQNLRALRQGNFYPPGTSPTPPPAVKYKSIEEYKAAKARGEIK